MTTLDRLLPMLPEDAERAARGCAGTLREIRLRAGRPVQLVYEDGDLLTDTAVDAARLRRIAAAMMDYSVYAREDELSRGFFTLPDGCRVGVCGRVVGEGERLRLSAVGSICVRVARAVPGCADALVKKLFDGETLRSALILSPPGFGKTTMLRDAARQLSDGGYCVGIADERHEIAACCQGVPTLNVGVRSDVVDGCPRSEAIRRLVRSMAPQVIAVDEIGGTADAAALADAARCGVAILATAHGASLSDIAARDCVRNLLSDGLIQVVVLLGSRPGQIRRIVELESPKEAADACRSA
ncbi:MAG: stage III sporulation protein AA [Clostridia bacterium]|nr:stage III sporulation protein AA [Clostridia bacterium]